MLWRKGVNLNLRNYSVNHIDVDIVEDDGFTWRFTGIYGEPRLEHKHRTWRLLRDLHRLRDLPWLCTRDFNEILHHHEKKGGVLRSQVYLDNFKQALEDCDLSDLGFIGDVYTWHNNQHNSDDYIKERLDRAIANGGWRARFSHVAVHNGDPYHSDHRPVIITTETAHRRRRGRVINLLLLKRVGLRKNNVKWW